MLKNYCVNTYLAHIYNVAVVNNLLVSRTICKYLVIPVWKIKVSEYYIMEKHAIDQQKCYLYIFQNIYI
jgi:hypothetical protein